VHTINVGIQPSGIVASLDGRYIYVCNYNTLYAGADFTNLTAGQGTVNIIDTSTNTLIPPTITVGQSPGNISINSNGKYIYVSNFTSNTISVIST
jgi:DNA-binding beta-propeller fold protein YncE